MPQEAKQIKVTGAVAGQVMQVGSGLFLEPSGFTGVNAEAVCKGWVRFDGTGTIAIDDSFNVSSIVDNGTGNYTVNWGIDFDNADYSPQVSASLSETSILAVVVGSCGVGVFNSSGTLTDTNKVTMQAFGDNANLSVGGSAPGVKIDSLCKGWVAFDGTGSISIDDSFNVSSLTDNGVGQYAVNWDVDFDNINYSIQGTSSNTTAIGAPTVGFGIILTTDSDGAFTDASRVHVQAFGDNPIALSTEAVFGPAGADTQVQFNDAGVFGNDAGFTYNKTSNSPDVAGAYEVGGQPALRTSDGDGGGTKTVLVGDTNNTANTGTDNVFVGVDSGRLNSSGIRNTCVGFKAGESNTINQQNTFVGWKAGTGMTGSSNTYIGSQTGISSTGEANVMVGQSTGDSLVTGNNNVMLGKGAAQAITGGSGNVFIGSDVAGAETGSLDNELWIHNSNTATPLIQGNFSDKTLIINGTLQAQREVEANTAVAASPNALTVQESRKLLTNEGVAAENVHDLPSAVAGMEYTFVVQDVNGIQVNANTDDTIRIAGSVSATAGLIEATAVGSTVTIVAINATEWVATSLMGGPWTVT